MSTASGRVFALVAGDGQDFSADWGYIAAGGVQDRTGPALLQTWNHRYHFCRAVFSKEDAAKAIAITDADIVSPPRLYIVIDSDDGDKVIAAVVCAPEEVAAIWITSPGERVVEECNKDEWMFAAIRERTQLWLDLTVEHETDNETTKFLREFDLRWMNPHQRV